MWKWEMIWNKSLWKAMCRQAICCVPAPGALRAPAAAMQSQDGMCARRALAPCLLLSQHGETLIQALVRLFLGAAWIPWSLLQA